MPAARPSLLPYRRAPPYPNLARCSFKTHRSITTNIPAFRAFSAAPSLITPSCSQIAGIFNWIACSTISSTNSGRRNTSTRSIVSRTRRKRSPSRLRLPRRRQSPNPSPNRQRKFPQHRPPHPQVRRLQPLPPNPEPGMLQHGHPWPPDSRRWKSFRPNNSR